MVRVKIPGGVLTPDQYLTMDRLADEVVYNRSLWVTTRQNFQLHGLLKANLKQAIKRVNETLLSSLSGCGDVKRNVMAPPARPPFRSRPPSGAWPGPEPERRPVPQDPGVS